MKKGSWGFLIFAFVFTVFPIDVRGADWVHYGTNAFGDACLYDKTSIRKVAKNVIKVWEKTVYANEGRAEIIRLRGQFGLSIDGFESLKESNSLYFINCRDEKCKITDIVDYASDGCVLNSAQLRDDNWANVTPDSIAGKLLRAVCK